MILQQKFFLCVCYVSRLAAAQHCGRPPIAFFEILKSVSVTALNISGLFQKCIFKSQYMHLYENGKNKIKSWVGVHLCSALKAAVDNLIPILIIVIAECLFQAISSALTIITIFINFTYWLLQLCMFHVFQLVMTGACVDGVVAINQQCINATGQGFD